MTESDSLQVTCLQSVTPIDFSIPVSYDRAECDSLSCLILCRNKEADDSVLRDHFRHIST